MANGDNLHIKDVWDGVEIKSDTERATKDSLIMISSAIQCLPCKAHDKSIGDNRTNILLHENTHRTEDKHTLRTAVIISAITSIVIALAAVLALRG